MVRKRKDVARAVQDGCGCDVVVPTFVVVADTREQAPFTFHGVPCKVKGFEGPVVVERGTLRTGDYSVRGFEARVAVERKSLADLFGSCGAGRERFEREMERLGGMEHAALVCEGDWEAILRTPPSRSALPPVTVLQSIIAWGQRFGVHFWPCPNRAFAERATLRILERFYRDVMDGKRPLSAGAVAAFESKEAAGAPDDGQR